MIYEVSTAVNIMIYGLRDMMPAGWTHKLDCLVKPSTDYMTSHPPNCNVNLFLSLYPVLQEVLLAETILIYMTCHGSTQWRLMSIVMYILDHNSL